MGIHIFALLQRVKLKKKHPDDTVQKIMKNYIQRLIEKHRELCSWNNIQRIIENNIQKIKITKTLVELYLENNIQRITFRDPHDFHIFIAQERNQYCLYGTRRYFNTLKGQRTLSNNE